jgi:hypothetical protein
MGGCEKGGEFFSGADDWTLLVMHWERGEMENVRAVHVYSSAFKQLARHESTHPPVAPKKAMFLDEDIRNWIYADVDGIRIMKSSW